MAVASILKYSVVFLVISFHGFYAMNTSDAIKLGSSIQAGDKSSWISASGDFAFGFYRLPSGLFLVGIWFNKIPERTLVWSANRDDPAQLGSTINFTVNGQLLLIHSNGRRYSIYDGDAASSASMKNDGNFVLSNSSSKFLWQSFDYPTDTVLPGQALIMGRKLFSNSNGTVDYSTGSFMLELQMDGNVVLSAYRFAEPGYWYTATENNQNISLIFNQSTDYMYVINTTSIAYRMTTNVPTPVEDYYHRATINDHGNLQQFVYKKGNMSGWTVVWQAVTEPCTVVTICGVFGFCTSPDNTTVNCECLPGYVPFDPDNPSKGCYPVAVKDFCAPNSRASDFTVEAINNADIPNGYLGQTEIIQPADADACRRAVMEDCFCMAAVLNKSICYKKRMPLLTARRSYPSTNNSVAFIKFPISNGTLIMQDNERGYSVSKLVMLAGLVLCSVLAFLFAIIIIYYHPVTRPYLRLEPPSKPKPVLTNLKEFSFQELREATNGFKNRIGRGAFGTVYSGVLTLDDEVVDVAVKQLEKVIEQGEKEFLTEARIIGLTHHRNLVQLLGFCNEHNHRLLVYELMKNGTLSSFLFGVMLLEIVFCRRHIELNRVEEENAGFDMILTDWVLYCVKAGSLEVMVCHDSEIVSDFKRFERMVMVGLWCICPNPNLRPSMKKTVEMLEGSVENPVRLNSSLTAGTDSSWRSDSGDFAFGFRRLSNNQYLLGVWFDKIPDKTLIWTANRDEPVEEGSLISLTYDGKFVLTYFNGSVRFIYPGAAAANGIMQDNGNFVLSDSNSNMLWQSFDSPTDTIVPGQVLDAGKKLLSNTRGTTNYSTGNFKLEMQSDGNLVLSADHFSDLAYWYSFYGPLDQTNVRLVFDNTSALMYLVNGTHHNIYNLTTSLSVAVEDYFHRATIDDHGNFQHYGYPRKNGGSWTRIWRAVTDPCNVTAVCGVFGLCSSSNGEASCNCLPGYIPLDPSNPSGGCHPEVMLNYCKDPSMRNFTVEEIEDADFPSKGFMDLAQVKNVDVEGCKQAVMDDCFSSVAVWDSQTCIKKRMPLWNGRRTASAVGKIALVKVPMKNNNQGDKKKDADIPLKAGLFASGLLAFLFGVLALYYHPMPRRLLLRRSASNANKMDVNFREFTFQELREATNDFSRALGRGSSGKVYGGTLILKDKRIEIAVKMLQNVIDRNEKEFMTELKIIGRTHHKNLVRLLGFCYEGNHRLLVYEFMKNGPLSDFLFAERARPSWAQRAEMALGIARGLLYLHEECKTQIIHCDIKPQNVLLDSNDTPKIADFGLSKLLNKEQTRTCTAVRGTIGYMAPEWLRNVPVTAKVDVFSFGVMLLEIICGRRHIELSRVEEETDDADLVLMDWVLSCVISGKLEMLVNHDMEVMSDSTRFQRMVMVGLWCIHPDPILRPSMKKVTQMLEGTIDIGVPPMLFDQMSKDKLY
ncbi:Bulb-type lectin domain [Dillenia turbinata]|uniref:non-specific serine/threonine protein kinase n=1 Tax=Dillenia turbinata TaxID=194707 RepID=A0AAN8UNQ8_9MAGN